MRRLLILIIALSLGPLAGHAGGAAFMSAGSSTDCVHQSTDGPHHDGTHHRPGKKAPPCCTGLCFTLATLPSAPAKEVPIALAIGQPADDRGEPRDIEPADPPPRS